MANYAQGRLEFSPDPLSNTSPTYVDVTSYLISASWSTGQARELDQPQAGVATFVLKNRNRDFEPQYANGRFAGSIVPFRRFRWSITAAGVSRPQGTWYARSYSVDYPDRGSSYSTTTVECVDGFGLLSLATLPQLDPPTGETINDVIMFDNPFAYYPLDEEAGPTVNAAIGPNAIAKVVGDRVLPNPVIGDAHRALWKPATSDAIPPYAKAKLDDTDLWHDAGMVSVEGVVRITANATGVMTIGLGPFDTPSSDNSFRLTVTDAEVRFGASTVLTATNPGTVTAGSHHVCMTYDGSALILYLDGAAVARAAGSNQPISPDANENLYIAGGPFEPNTQDVTVSHVAFYTYALTPARVAAHAAAALNRGYPAQTAGTRIAALATNPLWSTAGIPAGTITVTPRMQHGQGTLDEITTTTQAESPIGLFYFNDAGNPSYAPWEYDTTLQGTFGDAAGEIPYDAIQLVYDDDLYNTSTVTRDGGLAQTAQDTTSIAAYGARGLDQTGLIVALDRDANLIAQTNIDRFSTPQFRFDNVTLNGSDPRARTQILTRDIGDTIRIRRRGDGGTPIDVETRIIGKQKTLDVHGDLRCTWTLARGFPAATQVWRIGVAGYTEIGQTTILG